MSVFGEGKSYTHSPILQWEISKTSQLSSCLKIIVPAQKYVRKVWGSSIQNKKIYHNNVSITGVHDKKISGKTYIFLVFITFFEKWKKKCNS